MASVTVGTNRGVSLLWCDLNAERTALIHKVFCGMIAAIFSRNSAN
jgi:hypothetical protein